jgi:hypothetical protein
MNSRFVLLVIALLLIASIANAEPWKKTIDLGFTITQNSYSDNWVGGEAGNIAWISLANGIFEKQVSPKFNFRNNTNLQFGQTHSQDKGTKNWNKPVKSTDKIDIDNLGRFTLNSFVDPFVAFRLQSQFLDGSYAPKERLLNPLLLTESAGIAKSLLNRDKDQIITRLGFSLRQNLDRAIDINDSTNTKLQTDTDGGLESVTDINYKLAKNVNYVGKLTLFKALFFSKADDFKGTPAEDYWKAADANWESTIAASINKYIVVNLYTQLLYDKQVSLKGRFKENFGLGFTYKLQ